MIASALILFAFQFAVGLLVATLHLVFFQSSTVASPASLGVFLGAMIFGTWRQYQKPDSLKPFAMKLKVSLLNALLHGAFGVFLFYSGAVAALELVDGNMKISILLIAVALAFALTLTGITLGIWNLRHYPSTTDRS
jgi:hypothetical protein